MSTTKERKAASAFFGGTNSRLLAFSVPADFSRASIECLLSTRDGRSRGIVEVYGSLRPDPLAVGSGRAFSVLPKVSFRKFSRYVQDLITAEIEFNYTLNTSCLGNREYSTRYRRQLHDLVKSLRDVGVTRFTVALPSLLDMLADIDDIKVTISTILGVASPFGVRFVEAFPNVDRICIPEWLNRNLKRLRVLIDCSSLTFSTIVNSLCLLSCPFRHQHYDFNAHAHALPRTGKRREYYGIVCDTERFQNPYQWLSAPWIRPEDLHLYLDLGVSLFKISGREIPNADYVRVVRIYQQGVFDSNLLELFTCFGENPYTECFFLPSDKIAKVMPEILSRKEGCHELLCSSCGICQSWAEKHISIKHDARQATESIMRELLP